jgi:hypothetical protein
MPESVELQNARYLFYPSQVFGQEGENERSVAPLIPAYDLILIDTSDLSIAGMTKRVLGLVAQKGLL